MSERITMKPDRAAEWSLETRKRSATAVRRPWVRDRIPMLGFLTVVLFAALVLEAPDVRAAEPVDVIFVLDNSGSMRQNDPEYLTRKAVTNFASALAEDSSIEGRIAVVLFDGKARLVQGLTAIEPGRVDSLLEPALAELDFSGRQTNSPAGIERALYEFRNNGREGARRAIIFLTDGEIDTGDGQKDSEAALWLREDLADESEASGIRIFGVAFTDSADYQLIQALARRTHGDYYRAFEAGELNGVVEDVLAKIAKDDFYRQSLADLDPPNVETTGPGTPPVSAAPVADSSGGDLSLLALLPVALLLAGGALVWRRRAARNAVEAPAAQLLDIRGELGPKGGILELSRSITRIGRDPHNDIVIVDDTISSEHAVILVREGRYWLEDQRSTNGTGVGNQRLEVGQRVQLKGGDHIRFADIEMTFVLAGYVPVEATVFLSAPSGGPTAGSSLADEASSVADEASSVADASLTPMFQLPSADDDHRNHPGEVPPETGMLEIEPTGENDPLPDASQPSIRRGPLSLLPTPEEPADDGLPVEIRAFRQSLEYHLDRIAEISPAFADFVESAFDDELRSALAVSASELTANANRVGQIQQKQYTFGRVRFAICGVPGEMDDACDHFVESFGGFTRLLTELLRSDSFRSDRCEMLVVLTAGQSLSPWVSLSMVPEGGEGPRIDLLSYEFLTLEERNEIESSEQVEVSHSGIA